MDEQKPLWQTAWYWKKLFLYLFLPLNIVLAMLATLTRTGRLSTHRFDTTTMLLTSLAVVAFTIWANHQAKKHTADNIS